MPLIGAERRGGQREQAVNGRRESRGRRISRNPVYRQTRHIRKRRRNTTHTTRDSSTNTTRRRRRRGRNKKRCISDLSDVVTQWANARTRPRRVRKMKNSLTKELSAPATCVISAITPLHERHNDAFNLSDDELLVEGASPTWMPRLGEKRRDPCGHCGATMVNAHTGRGCRNGLNSGTHGPNAKQDGRENVYIWPSQRNGRCTIGN